MRATHHAPSGFLTRRTGSVGAPFTQALRACPASGRRQCATACAEYQRQSVSTADQRRPASRRAVLLSGTAVLAASMLSSGAAPQPAYAAAEDEPPKLTGLTADQMLDKIKEDFQKRQYYVTGNLSPELFADDCLFVDPTVQVRGWKFYTNAVRTLFDADHSRADIRSIKVVDGRTISLDWRLEGQIKPWFNAEIKPYTGTTVYKLSDEGLVYEHLESWNAPAYDVFLSVLFPKFGVPPAPPVDSAAV